MSTMEREFRSILSDMENALATLVMVDDTIGVMYDDTEQSVHRVRVDESTTLRDALVCLHRVEMRAHSLGLASGALGETLKKLEDVVAAFQAWAEKLPEDLENGTEARHDARMMPENAAGEVSEGE